jgi:hypothetical protein
MVHCGREEFLLAAGQTCQVRIAAKDRFLDSPPTATRAAGVPAAAVERSFMLAAGRTRTCRLGRPFGNRLLRTDC